MKLVVFDVETKKAFDEVGGYYPEKLGVSISGVYYRETDDHSSDKSNVIEEWIKGFREEEFPEMFKLFERADRIVGFNSIGFDMMTLSPYYVGDLLKLPNLDIMLEMEKKLGHRVALDAVAKETLGTQKIGHGLDAIRYYHDGDWESLTKYCLRDVEVTRDIYDYAVINKKLKFKNKWNNLIEVDLELPDFVSEKSTVQTTLF